MELDITLRNRSLARNEQAGLYGEEVFEIVSCYNEEFYPEKSTLLKMDFEEALLNLKINL